jgi:hypothetical protein
LDRSTTSAIATAAVMLAHSNSTKRCRVLFNEAYPAGQDIPVPHNITLPPQFDGLEHAGFSFHDDDEANKAPMMSSTTSERSMVKLMKILEDMSAPDYAVEVIIEWDQTSLVGGFDFCPKNKMRAGNVANLYNAVHNATLLLPLIVAMSLLENPSPVDVIVYDFVPQYLSSLLQDA